MDSLKFGPIELHKTREMTLKNYLLSSKPWFHLANKLLFLRPNG